MSSKCTDSNTPRNIQPEKHENATQITVGFISLHKIVFQTDLNSRWNGENCVSNQRFSQKALLASNRHRYEFKYNPATRNM